VTGRGAWHGVDPSKLSVPTLEFVSRHDRIVPAATSAKLPNRWLLGAGHVGMIVGSKAKEQLWQPLARCWRRKTDRPTNGGKKPRVCK
jgi:polyhydroxyalkanoate synthase subunit PhaC